MRTDAQPFQGETLWMAEAQAAWDDSQGWLSLPGIAAPVGAGGRFDVPALDAGSVLCAAILPDRWIVLTPPFVPPQAGTWPFVADDGFESLDVRVAWAGDGSPVPGAAVLATGETPSGGFARVRAIADAQGRCSLRAIGRGVGRVWVYARGFEEGCVERVGGPSGSNRSP